MNKKIFGTAAVLTILALAIQVYANPHLLVRGNDGEGQNPKNGPDCHGGGSDQCWVRTFAGELLQGQKETWSADCAVCTGDPLPCGCQDVSIPYGVCPAPP